jgi:hypothetical protein
MQSSPVPQSGMAPKALISNILVQVIRFNHKNHNKKRHGMLASSVSFENSLSLIHFRYKQGSISRFFPQALQHDFAGHDKHLHH